MGGIYFVSCQFHLLVLCVFLNFVFCEAAHFCHVRFLVFVVWEFRLLLCDVCKWYVVSLLVLIYIKNNGYIIKYAYTHISDLLLFLGHHLCLCFACSFTPPPPHPVLCVCLLMFGPTRADPSRADSSRQAGQAAAAAAGGGRPRARTRFISFLVFSYIKTKGKLKNSKYESLQVF